MGLLGGVFVGLCVVCFLRLMFSVWLVCFGLLGCVVFVCCLRGVFVFCFCCSGFVGLGWGCLFLLLVSRGGIFDRDFWWLCLGFLFCFLLIVLCGVV